jgi:hypothetical protein
MLDVVLDVIKMDGIGPRRYSLTVEEEWNQVL